MPPRGPNSGAGTSGFPDRDAPGGLTRLRPLRRSGRVPADRTLRARPCRHRQDRSARPALLLLAALTLVSACGGGVPLDPYAAEEVTPREREWFVRRRLEDALDFRHQGRVEAALRQIRLARSVAADDPRVLRLEALLLEEAGRLEEARARYARADALDPPPFPPSEEPIAGGGRGVQILLLPPDPDAGRDAPANWPLGGLADALAEYLGRRLPGARVEPAEPHSLPEVLRFVARVRPRVLVSLRVERSRCGDSPREGPFGYAWLRVAAAAGGERIVGPTVVRARLLDYRERHACPEIAVTRAAEHALEIPELRAALAKPAAVAGVTAEPALLRPLFPGIARRIGRALAEARRLLVLGRLEEAVRVLEAARSLDPGHPRLRQHLAEARASLELAREILARTGLPLDDLSVDPQLTPAQRAAAEAHLEEERRERERLLAALAIAEVGGRRLPPAESLAALRPVPGYAGPGIELAARLAGEPVELRRIEDRAGGVLAAYVVTRSSGRPVLFAEDTDGDGRPDRFTAYRKGLRSEVFELPAGRRHPAVHVVLEPDGDTPRRIELDRDGDGRAERVFDYEAGRLRAEAADTDGDAVLDRFDRLDEEGHVARRDEDLDGDGDVDLRSHYRAGRLVRREVLDPSFLRSAAPEIPDPGPGTGGLTPE